MNEKTRRDGPASFFPKQSAWQQLILQQQQSQPVKSIEFQGYSPRASGDVFTGEVQTVRGGGRCAVIWSGALAPNLSCAPGATASGGHVLIFSGAGRLDSILPHVQMASGVQAFFYDAGAIAPSGISASGQWIIGIIPTTWTGGQLGSGAVNAGQPWNGEPLRPEMPFHSGLCVACPSGAPGFTIGFTPEVSAAFPNP